MLDIYAAALSAHITLGPIISIPLGFKLGLSPLEMAASYLAADFVCAAVLLLFMHEITRLPFLHKYMARLRSKAAAYNVRITRRLAKELAVFAFVLVPLYGTGKFSGTILGYFLGLRYRTILAVVLTGSATAIALIASGVWFIFF